MTVIRLIKRSCILAVILAALMVVPGFSALAESPGSVEIRLPKTAKDAQMSLYQAAVYQDGTFVFTEDFSDAPALPEDLENAEELQSAADTLAAWVKGNGAEGVTGRVDPDGSIRFTGLEPALYLILQTGGEEYLEIQSVLIPIPFVDLEGQESYDAVVSPKYVFPGGAVILNKTDAEGKALSGAHFTLEQKVYDESSAKEDFSWKRLQADLVTGTGGQIAVTGLPQGEYRFLETKAPDGYILSDRSADFTIELGGRVEEVKGVYTAQAGRVEELTFINEAVGKDPSSGDSGGSSGTSGNSQDSSGGSAASMLFSVKTGDNAPLALYILLLLLAAVGAVWCVRRFRH